MQTAMTPLFHASCNGQRLAVQVHVKKIGSRQCKFSEFDVTRPRRFKMDVEFVKVVEVKAYEIAGKYISEKRNLLIKILGVDYKHFY